MLTWRLALRNLWRHKRRTLITASAITFSYALMVVFQGMSEGSHRQMIDMGVRMGAGHVVVQAAGYQQEKTLDYRISAPAAVFAAVEDLAPSGAVAPRLLGAGLARAGSRAVGVGIAGVDPARELAASDLASADKRLRGDWLRPRAELAFANLPSDLYLGETLARTLSVDVGDRVALTVQPKDASVPRSAAFLVRGVFRTGNDDIDGFFVQVPLEDAQALLGVGGAVSQVAVVLDDQDETPALRAALTQALADQPVEVLAWQQALPELHEFILIDDASMYLFLGILFLLVALGIFNTVLASVMERTREFGLLIALGARPGGQFRLVLLEALLIGVLGLALGLLLGLAGNHYFATEGLDYAALAGDSAIEAAGLNLGTVLYARLSPGNVAGSLAAVFVVVLLSALWPALRAARLKPLEALHHV